PAEAADSAGTGPAKDRARVVDPGAEILIEGARMIARARRPEIHLETFHLAQVALAGLMRHVETEPSDEFRQCRGDRLVDAVGTLAPTEDEQAAGMGGEIRSPLPELFPNRRSRHDRRRVEVASRLGVGGGDDARHMRERPRRSAGRGILFLQYDWLG